MDKYQGIGRANAKFTESDEIRTKGTVRESGYLTGFLMRVLLAGLLLAAIFGIKFAPLSFSEPVIETVKTAVTFDLNESVSAGEYLTDKLKELFGA